MPRNATLNKGGPSHPSVHWSVSLCRLANLSRDVLIVFDLSFKILAAVKHSHSLSLAIRQQENRVLFFACDIGIPNLRNCSIISGSCSLNIGCELSHPFITNNV